MVLNLALLVYLTFQWFFSAGVLARHHGNHLNHVYSYVEEIGGNDVATKLDNRQDHRKPLLRLSESPLT
jgi:hypothetical protein